MHSAVRVLKMERFLKRDLGSFCFPFLPVFPDSTIDDLSYAFNSFRLYVFVDARNAFENKGIKNGKVFKA